MLPNDLLSELPEETPAEQAREARTRDLVYMGACLIAGMRLAREKQVHPGVIEHANAIEESIELAWAIQKRFDARYPEYADEAETLVGQTNARS